MKKPLLALTLWCCALLNVNAQTIRTPAPSPTQTIQQDFGIGTITLNYSRPGMKGRKIFGGDVVPYNKIWRTGANNATTLTFTDEVIIGGTKIPAGKYGLVSIPGPQEWTLILTKQLDITSPAAYKAENDIVRVTAKATALPQSVETFTMQFANVKSASAELHIMWEKTAVSLPMTADIDSRIMAQIDNAINRDSRPYYTAAMYYMDNGKDLNQALAWLDKAVEQSPTAFWIHHQRANALARLGKKEDAKTAANKSIQLAREAQNDDYVRLNEELLKKLTQ